MRVRFFGWRNGKRCSQGALRAGLPKWVSPGVLGRWWLLITLDRRLIRGGSAAESRWISRRSWERWGGPERTEGRLGQLGHLGEVGAALNGLKGV